MDEGKNRRRTADTSPKSLPTCEQQQAAIDEIADKLGVVVIRKTWLEGTDGKNTMLLYLKEDLQEKKELLKKKKDLLTEKFSVLEPFGSMKLELQKVLHYKYMQVRFGRMAVDYYQRLGKYLYDDLDAVFIEAAQNDNYVYGCYFAANADVGKADSIFRSLHFERIRIPMEYIGTPQEACTNLQNDIKETTKRIEAAKDIRGDRTLD